MVTQIEAAARGSYPAPRRTGHGTPTDPVALAVALVFRARPGAGGRSSLPSAARKRARGDGDPVAAGARVLIAGRRARASARRARRLRRGDE